MAEALVLDSGGDFGGGVQATFLVFLVVLVVAPFDMAVEDRFLQSAAGRNKRPLLLFE